MGDGQEVTLRDALEYNGHYYTFYDDEDIWIGIYDADFEDDWKTWINGESVSYTNWGIGEPDDKGNGQDYGVIVNGGCSGEGYDIAPGEWDDVGDVTHHFICE